MLKSGNYNSSPLKTNPELISRLNGLIPGRPTNDVFGIFKYIFEKNLAMDVFCVREGNRANLFCQLLLMLTTGREKGKVFNYLSKLDQETLFNSPYANIFKMPISILKKLALIP